MCLALYSKPSSEVCQIGLQWAVHLEIPVRHLAASSASALQLANGSPTMCSQHSLCPLPYA
jgi:hypothetical protein